MHNIRVFLSLSLSLSLYIYILAISKPQDVEILCVKEVGGKLRMGGREEGREGGREGGRKVGREGTEGGRKIYQREQRLGGWAYGFR
jgi:hypothetical protein